MKNNMPIMMQIQPECDSFLANMKSAKQKSGKTNQQIADETGIPLSNISKFFSGNLASPNVFNAAGVCLCLQISLDKLFGIKPCDNTDQQIIALKAENEALQKELNFSRELIHALESIRSARSAYEAQKILLYGAVILIITLMIIGTYYITLDVKDPSVGFINSGTITPIGIVILGTALLALNSIMLLIRKIIKGRREKKD